MPLSQSDRNLIEQELDAKYTYDRFALTRAEIKAKQGELLGAARELLDKAERFRRPLSERERHVFGSLERRVGVLRDELDFREMNNLGDGPRDGSIKHDDPRFNPWAPSTSFNTRGTASHHLITESGKAVPVLEPRDSFAAATRRDWRLPDGIRADELDLGRWARGIVTGEWGEAQAELRATQIIGSDVLGGYAVPSPLSAQIIDLARNLTVLLKAGARTIPMTSSEQTFAKITSDLSTEWLPEDTQASETNLGLGKITLRARKLAAYVPLSIELAEDAENLGDVVRNALAQGLALELDRAGLLGDGAGEEPLGLYHDGDVNVIDMGTNGAALSTADNYDVISDAIEDIWEANGAPNALILGVREAGYFDRLKDGDGLPYPVPPFLQNLRRFVTNQIPATQTWGTATDASSIFVGDFTQLYLGLRSPLRVEVSREGDSAFSKFQVLMRAYMRADWLTARPTHFTVVKGIIP